MSSESIIALVAVITSGVVGLAGLGFNFWNTSSERKQRLLEFALNRDERYRERLYQKLLEAHQDAYRRVSEIAGIVSAASPTARDDVVDRVRSLHAWLDQTALYLDPVSSEEILRYTGICLEWASSADSPPLPYEQVREVLAVIAAGTGLKHLDTDFTKKIMNHWKDSSGDHD